uniref:Uncharacterized protein n=1 Tax=Arundo donax TaxID=35708 RepID=A0A0A9H319_ARUDO
MDLSLIRWLHILQTALLLFLGSMPSMGARSFQTLVPGRRRKLLRQSRTPLWPGLCGGSSC